MFSRINKNYLLIVSLGLLLPLTAYIGIELKAHASFKTDAQEPSNPEIKAPSRELFQPKKDFGKLPLYFTANRGQSPEEVKYYSVGSRFGLFLTGNGAILQLVPENDATVSEIGSENIKRDKNPTVEWVRLSFIGGEFSASPVAEEEMAGKVNYLVGRDASRWQTNISTFGKIRYPKLYPGIDLLFYGNQRELEYDFVVAPGADPDQIKLNFEGAKKILINRKGELELKLESGRILQRQPVAYQIIDGRRHQVTARFIKKGANDVSFRLGKYDRRFELIIDPIIVYSSYWGGNSTDTATAVKTDAEGNIYLTGATVSANFPTVNPLQPTFGGNFLYDAFVTKINPAGNAVIYSTYLGGESEDYATSLIVDAAGNAVLGGRTYSPNFPLVNALQSQLGGVADGFIAKLNPTGSALIYSTYLGGSAFEDILSTDLDPNGRVVVSGRTESGDFPTVSPFQGTISGTSFFRSTSNGASWTSSAIAPSVVSVSSYSVNPNAPNVIYAATNRGVFRSNDAGANWSPSGQTDLSLPVTKIAVARSNPNIIYAVAGGIIYKSTNGGGNWNSIQGDLFQFFNTVAVDPNNAETVYVGGFNAFVYKTSDGGANWSNVSITNVSSTVNTLAIDPVNTQIVYAGTSQRLYKSSSGGGGWAQLTSNLPSFTNYWDLLITPENNTIYAATQNGLYKSPDSGATWSPINLANLFAVRSVAQKPNNPALLFAVTSTGLCIRSVDGGASWTQSSDGLTGSGLLAVAATSEAVVIGGNRGTDAFVARFNAAGSALEFSTYLGGNLFDSASGVRAGSDGQVTVVGTTSSTNFPVANALQGTSGGGTDAFATRFGESGDSLIYSTYLGGSSTDSAAAIAVDKEGSTYLTGSTLSANFPVLNAIQSNCASCSGFLNDAYLAKLNPTGSGLVYSTFLGGSGSDSGLSLDVAPAGRTVVAGSTTSGNFPVFDAIQGTIAGGTDGFVSQISENGSGFIYSTYFGGSGNDTINSITYSPEGNAVLAGQTISFNFPTVSALQNAIGGSQDAMFAKIGVAADLEVLAADERDPVMINNQLIYNLTVKNNGPSASSSVVLTNPLPAGSDFVSATATQGDCAVAASVLTCNLGALAANVQISVRLVLTPRQTGTVTNTASVTASEPDPSAGNNTDTEQTLVSGSPSVSGKVTTATGVPAEEVAISVEGFQARTVQTNNAGVYSVAELPISGNYTVRPLKPGFYFSPRARIFNSLTRDETADFVINACSYTLSNTSATMTGAGGDKSIFITTNDPFCSWTATSNVPWIFVNSGASGFGNGTIKISVQPTSAPRSGTLTIAGQTFTVTQDGCSFSLVPFQQSFGQNGGAGTIQISASQSFCQWTSVSLDPWITITGSPNGTGSGTLSYTVAPATRPRSGRITIAGQNFPVYQEADFCPSPSFGAPLPGNIINTEAFDIVTSDFNNDNIPDLAAINKGIFSSIWSFSYQIGNGDGTFNLVNLPTPISDLSTLIAADFTGDGNNDLAILGSGRIALYPGIGNGGFSPPTVFNANTGFYTKLFAEDFDRDGDKDLLVGAANQFYVLKNNGTGTFQTGFTQNVTARSTYSYAMGDINGDGVSDMVVGSEQDFNVPRLTYFFGATDGTFSLGGQVPLGDITPFRLQVADLNGDGKADVITDGYLSSQVRVLLWNSAANQFGAATRVFTGSRLGSLYNVADINNDGKPDLVSGAGPISIVYGNGNGTFRLPVIYSSASDIRAFAFADYNRDGRLDIAYARYQSLSAVQLNQCAPNAKRERAGTTNYDFDADGKADFAVVRPSENVWYIYREQERTFVSQPFGSAGDLPVPSDYDADGKTDIAVFRPETGIWYRLNSSDNSFHAYRWGKQGDLPVTGDFDGDDRADLAVFRPSENTWYWLSSLNGQTHVIRFGLSDDKPISGDFDGDGKADLAVYRPSDNFWYWLNSSNGQFQSLHFGTGKDRPVPGDYDGDGKTDLAVFRASENVWYIRKGLLNQYSAVRFGAAGDLPVPADYDGDGKTDIAVFRQGTWHVYNSQSGDLKTLQFGLSGDSPVPAHQNR